MNEEIILSLVKKKKKNNQLTNKEFEICFGKLGLSSKEMQEVRNILEREGIDLIDVCEENYFDDELDGELLDSEESIDDDDLFRDSDDFIRNNVLQLSNNNEINQSNENLCVLIQQGDDNAKSNLCLKNKNLVAQYARKYKNYLGSKMTYDDIMQEGYIGLLKAADKFNVSLNNAFSTYAVWWIKQNITRAILNTGFMIRIPVHMVEKINKVEKLDREYVVEGLDCEQRMKSISEKLELEIEKVKETFEYRNKYLSVSSLNAPVGEEGSIELLDSIEDYSTLSPEEYLNKQLLKDEIDDILKGLTEREEKILRLRYGLYDGRNRTLEEVGKMFNLTRERIRQIEAKAIRKLKHPTRSNRLKDFY